MTLNRLLSAISWLFIFISIPTQKQRFEDYATLKSELTKFDIVGMLATEMQKSRISESLTKKLVHALKHISGQSRESAVVSLIDNLPILYPILPTVMMVLRDILPELAQETKETLFTELRNILGSQLLSLCCPN